MATRGTFENGGSKKNKKIEKIKFFEFQVDTVSVIRAAADRMLAPGVRRQEKKLLNKRGKHGACVPLIRSPDPALRVNYGRLKIAIKTSRISQRKPADRARKIKIKILV